MVISARLSVAVPRGVMQSESYRAPVPTSGVLYGVMALVFAVVATAIAMIRFRPSPLYPAFNDVNSDVYIYQLIGNSWVDGLLPYRDVFDVKGPFLFLLFGLFARLRPWSMGPPIVVLTLLAFASIWLAYAIARLYILQRPIAVLAALASSFLIYLSPTSVASSFTCEELAVPGILLMLWLVLRWLREPDKIANAWWVVDGLVLGALFWSKFLVVAPWAAMLVALLVLAMRGQLPARDLRRVIILHLVGVTIATALILPFYATVVPEMMHGYFRAMSANLDFKDELFALRQFVAELITSNTAVAISLVSILCLFLLRARRSGSRDSIALTIAFGLSLLGSIAVDAHPNSVFVPLSFVAVAIPQALSGAESRSRAVSRMVAIGVTSLSLAACVGALGQGVSSYGLLRHARPLTCYNLSTLRSTTTNKNVSTMFAEAAGGRPILSVGTLFAARSSYVSRSTMSHPFQIDYYRYSAKMGSGEVQTQYLQDRTFDYVWIHIAGLDKFHDLKAQIAHETYGIGPTQAAQRAALARNYLPVISCNNEILLRAR